MDQVTVSPTSINTAYFLLLLSTKHFFYLVYSPFRDKRPFPNYVMCFLSFTSSLHKTFGTIYATPIIETELRYAKQ